MQNAVATDYLNFASSSTQIASALSGAASQIPAASRECSSFTVSKTVSASGKDLQLVVTFVVDNAVPLTLLDVFTGSLQGTACLASSFHRLLWLH